MPDLVGRYLNQAGAHIRPHVSYLTFDELVPVILEAHKGQVDTQGAPYEQHLMDVVGGVTGDFDRCCALMHDVVEDTVMMAQELVDMGVSPRQVTVVLGLSHEPLSVPDALTGDERRLAKIAAYVEMVRGFIDLPLPLDLVQAVMRVKLADNFSNLREERLAGASKDRQLRWRTVNKPKYEQSVSILEQNLRTLANTLHLNVRPV